MSHCLCQPAALQAWLGQESERGTTAPLPSPQPSLVQEVSTASLVGCHTLPGRSVFPGELPLWHQAVPLETSRFPLCCFPKTRGGAYGGALGTRGNMVMRQLEYKLFSCVDVAVTAQWMGEAKLGFQVG